MKPRKLFGVVLRTAGVMLLAYALWFLSYGVAQFLGLPEEAPMERVHYLISGLLSLAIGWYFLRGAPLIVRLAYGRDRNASDTGHDAA